MKQTFLRIDSRNNLLWRDIQNERMEHVINLIFVNYINIPARIFRPCQFFFVPVKPKSIVDALAENTAQAI